MDELNPLPGLLPALDSRDAAWSILYKDGMLIIKIGEPTPRQLSLTQKYRVN